MADAIKAGDVVELKSGGLDMTVANVRESSGIMEAWCEWFVGDKKQSGAFALSSLKRVGAEESHFYPGS